MAALYSIDVMLMTPFVCFKMNGAVLVIDYINTGHTPRFTMEREVEKKLTFLSPGQMDRQVVARGRKLNLRRDLRWVVKRTRKFPRKYTQVVKKKAF